MTPSRSRPDDAGHGPSGAGGAQPPGPYGDERPPRPPRWDLYEDPEPSGEARGRRWALLVLAALPWFVIAAVLLRPAPAGEAPSDGGRAAELDDGADADVASSTGAAERPGYPDADPRTETPEVAPWDGSAPDSEAGSADPRSAITADEPLPEIDAIRIGGRVTPGTGEAGALAAVVARAWLGDVGAPLETRLGSAGTGAYVEHLVVEAVDFPAPGAAVVSVVAVLLDVADGAYTDARVVRVAVPVHLTRDGVRPAGVPWWLPAPDLRPRDGDWEVVDDPVVLADAGAALAAAGYRDIAVERLEHAGGWALRATARAIAPGRDDAEEHLVWLREHLGGLVVAGWLPQPPAGDRPPGDDRATPSPAVPQPEPTP